MPNPAYVLYMAASSGFGVGVGGVYCTYKTSARNRIISVVTKRLQRSKFQRPFEKLVVIEVHSLKLASSD